MSPFINAWPWKLLEAGTWLDGPEVWWLHGQPVFKLHLDITHLALENGVFQKKIYSPS